LPEGTPAHADAAEPAVEVVTAAHGLTLERNERLQDAIGAGLARAMETWCTTRDVKSLRRALLQLLAELD
jgi:hypothetical protein